MLDITTILAQPTELKPPHDEVNEPAEVTNLVGLEFEDAPEPEEDYHFEDSEEDPTFEPLEEIELYNPEENAEILVKLIDVANIQTLTPIARWKLQRKLGGRQEVRKKQILFEKKLNKGELTEDEQREIELYQLYLKDKEEVDKAIPYTDEEKEALTKAAIPYMKAHKIKIGGGAAFWTQLALIQGSRIINVLTA